MPIDTFDWTMFANNDATFRVNVKDENGGIVNLTGYSARLEIKLTDDIATSPYISKSTSSATQALITNPASGIVEFYIVTTDFTTAPSYNRPYHYAVKIKSGIPKEYTVLKGTVKFHKPVFTAIP